MPYILDKTATHDLERWLLRAAPPSLCETDVYRFAASQMPDSVWEACGFRVIQSVDLVLGDTADEDFLEVVAQNDEMIDYVGSEMWLLPYINAETLKKLRASLAI